MLLLRACWTSHVPLLSAVSGSERSIIPSSSSVLSQYRLTAIRLE